MSRGDGPTAACVKVIFIRGVVVDGVVVVFVDGTAAVIQRRKLHVFDTGIQGDVRRRLN